MVNWFINTIIKMEVKFKKLKEGAIIPSKATDGSAAYDLYAPEDILITKGRFVIPLGFAMEMPKGIQALIDPRSGFSARGMEGYRYLKYLFRGEEEETTFVSDRTYRFDCDVIEGKIDSDYRGEVGAIVYNNDNAFLLKKGTRLAQMTFQKVETVEWNEVEELSESDRKGGFGSTGVK